MARIDVDLVEQSSKKLETATQNQEKLGAYVKVGHSSGIHANTFAFLVACLRTQIDVLRRADTRRNQDLISGVRIGKSHVTALHQGLQFTDDDSLDPAVEAATERLVEVYTNPVWNDAMLSGMEVVQVGCTAGYIYLE